MDLSSSSSRTLHTLDLSANTRCPTGICTSSLSGNSTILHPTPQRPTVLVTPKPIFGAAAPLEQTEPVDFSTGTAANGAPRVGVIAGSLPPLTVHPMAPDPLPMSPPPAIVPHPSPIRSPYSQIQSPITLQASLPSQHPTSLSASLPPQASLPPSSGHPVSMSLATGHHTMGIPAQPQQQCPVRIVSSTTSQQVQSAPSTIQRGCVVQLHQLVLEPGSELQAVARGLLILGKNKQPFSAVFHADGQPASLFRHPFLFSFLVHNRLPVQLPCPLYPGVSRPNPCGHRASPAALHANHQSIKKTASIMVPCLVVPSLEPVFIVKFSVRFENSLSGFASSEATSKSPVQIIIIGYNDCSSLGCVQH
ncbi:myelin transcription factor 1-like protein [Trichonephila clavipes]|nr:myelin transcription factor 1-like protein [Trichonephila clavipes]